MGYNSWDELRKGRNTHQLTDVIVEGLRKVKDVYPLSRETVEFLCSYNNIRQILANHVAHNASQIEIQKLSTWKRILRMVCS